MDRLRVILARAFDCGVSNSAELRGQVADELLAEFNVSAVGSNRVYTVAELLLLPLGTTFLHSVLGKGWLMMDGAMRVMFFEKNHKKAMIRGDTFPWTEKMSLIPGLTFS